MESQPAASCSQSGAWGRCSILSASRSRRASRRQDLAPSPATATAAPLRASSFLLSSLLLLLSITSPASVFADDGGWHKGRATRYGGPDDWWNINEGSCGYGYLDKDKATGWDIAAMSDMNWDFGGSCGRCIEVRCDPSTFSDYYGETFDRTGVCRDAGASVIVQVTDTCPCDYPTNAFSNRRWCCGDMYHLDISTYAFEKLAENKWGVIGIAWRPVSCDYQPERRAPVPPEGESPENTRIPRPWGWTDKRPWP